MFTALLAAVFCGGSAGGKTRGSWLTMAVCSSGRIAIASPATGSWISTNLIVFRSAGRNVRAFQNHGRLCPCALKRLRVPSRLMGSNTWM
jgi:hypothetical protein